MFASETLCMRRRSNRQNSALEKVCDRFQHRDRNGYPHFDPIPHNETTAIDRQQLYYIEFADEMEGRIEIDGETYSYVAKNAGSNNEAQTYKFGGLTFSWHHRPWDFEISITFPDGWAKTTYFGVTTVSEDEPSYQPSVHLTFHWWWKAGTAWDLSRGRVVLLVAFD